MAKVDINVLGGAIGEVAKAISEMTKAIYAYMSASDVRRMKKCIKNSDLLVERLSELGVDDKLVNKYVKRHQKYNN